MLLFSSINYSLSLSDSSSRILDVAAKHLSVVLLTDDGWTIKRIVCLWIGMLRFGLSDDLCSNDIPVSISRVEIIIDAVWLLE